MAYKFFARLSLSEEVNIMYGSGNFKAPYRTSVSNTKRHVISLKKARFEM